MNKIIGKRRIFNIFGSKSTSKSVLISSDTQLKIDRYRGNTEDFLDNVNKYEQYLEDVEECSVNLDDKDFVV